jgi:antirestriction protein
MEQQANEPPRTEQPEENKHEADRQHPAPQIYLASLADYNAGRLHGTWIDAAQEPEALAAAAQTMLAASPTTFAEEYAIHDFEGFGPLRLSEYQSLDTVSLVARGIAEHGAAFAHWAALVDELTPDELGRFDDVYLGHFESPTAYAESLLDHRGLWREIEEFNPAMFQPYVQVDVEGFARDLELSGDVLTSEGDSGVYVFEGGRG